MKMNVLTVENVKDSKHWMSELVSQTFPLSKVVEAGSFKSGLMALQKQPFHIVLLELDLPDGSGVGLIEHIAQAYPGTTVVVMTTYDDEQHLFAALRAGAKGYLLKNQSRRALEDKLNKLMLGEPPLSPSIARLMINHFAEIHPDEEMKVALTGREEQVLVLLSRGMSRREIADILKLSQHTIAYYIKDLYRKIGVNSRAEAAVMACQIGLIRVG